VKYFLVLLCGVLFVFGAGEATGAVDVYSNEADYTAAAGTELFFLDFNESPTPGEYVSGSILSAEIEFGSPEASDPSLVLWSSDAITDAGSPTASNNVGPMSGEFTNSVRAFGLYFSSAGEQETINLFDEADNLIDFVIGGPGGFFGVISDVPIKRFEIINGLFPNTYPDRFFIDDFRANDPVPEALTAPVDIKPGSCPNPLNMKSKGVLPVAILGTFELDVTTIDVASIRLEGVAPIRSSVEDVSGDNCAEEVPDGYLDMTLKFDTQEILSVLGGEGGVSDGDEIILQLTGSLGDGTKIDGDDSVLILKKGKNK